MEISKLSKIQQGIVRKALHHLNEAGDLLCCSNSPYWHVKDQEKVFAIIKECRNKLMNIK